MDTFRLNKFTKFIFTFIILVFVALALTPVFIMVSRSFFTLNEITSIDAGLLPRNFHPQNYIDAFKDLEFLNGLKNTFIICICGTIGIPLTAFMSAYAFTKIDFIGKKFWFTIGLGTMMIPGILLLLPVFKIFVDIGWYDTLLPLTIPSFFGGGIMNIFLIMQFMRGIPKVMYEAAEMDGANTAIKMFYITLPLILPVMTFVTVTAFFGQWNDFMRPLLYIRSRSNYTVNLYLYQTYMLAKDITESAPNMQMTFGVILMIPMVVVFSIFQKQLIEGIQLGSIK